MNLASVQKITSLEPIEGADAIEKATVLGWQVVVKKGEFSIGDLVCYVQIDTVVPETEQFEFLRPRKFRVRTIKLRGCISQGLIIPLEKGLPKEGDDLTVYFGIKKYEKPYNNPQRLEKPRVPKVWYKKWIYLFKYNIWYKTFPSLLPKTRSPFPTQLVPKTDEERIQNIPQVLEKHKGEQFYVSYKLDGSSITILHERVFGRNRFRICSRNFELHDKQNDWYRTFKSNNFDQEILKLVNHFDTNDIIVQGECIGKFNGNHHNLTSDKIYLFNIYVDGKRLKPFEFNNTCYRLSIPCVPLLDKIDLNHSLEEVLSISEQGDIFNHKAPLEGLVWRNKEGTVSFKAINNNYLLKKGE